MRFRKSLFAWDKENSIDYAYRLFDFTMGMLGTAGDARDCEELAEWVLHELKTIGDGVPFRDDLVTAGVQALSFCRLLQKLPDVIPMPQCQILCDHMKSFILHYSRARLVKTSKLHVLMHLAHRIIVVTCFTIKLHICFVVRPAAAYVCV